MPLLSDDGRCNLKMLPQQIQWLGAAWFPTALLCRHSAMMLLWLLYVYCADASEMTAREGLTLKHRWG